MKNNKIGLISAQKWWRWWLSFDTWNLFWPSSTAVPIAGGVKSSCRCVRYKKTCLYEYKMQTANGSESGQWSTSHWPVVRLCSAPWRVQLCLWPCHTDWGLDVWSYWCWTKKAKIKAFKTSPTSISITQGLQYMWEYSLGLVQPAWRNLFEIF